MKAVDILKGAREIVSDPAKWTQSTFAKTPNGRRVSPDHPEASCFCMGGAIYRACPGSYDASKEPPELLKAFNTVRTIVGAGIARFNDFSTHAEVLVAFDRAIAKLDAEGGGAA